MRNRLPLLLCCLLCAPAGVAQDTSVPESVRLMVQRSQEASRYEQMALMQIEIQYREFLNALSSDALHKAAVEAEIIAVLSERAELSARVTNGQASTSELETVSDYNYLRTRLSPLLSAGELSLLDNRQSGPSAAQLKQQYSAELSRAALNLSDADKELVLDTLVRHLQRGGNNATELGQLSVDDLVAQQMQSLIQASNELQARFSGEEMQDVFNFVNQVQANLYRNRSMSDPAQ